MDNGIPREVELIVEQGCRKIHACNENGEVPISCEWLEHVFREVFQLGIITGAHQAYEKAMQVYRD